jgi:DNA-binding NtrC family response regulator
LCPMEALQKSEDFQGEIHLLLTDLRMPQMDGITLAQKLLAERPHIRTLLISADLHFDTELPLLRKPFRMEELLEKVAQVIDSPPPFPADLSEEQGTAHTVRKHPRRAVSSANSCAHAVSARGTSSTKRRF